ncbi:MAG: hypothetical protein JWN25_882 [Verrucomicrobiales bacterium]|nr:hypothetical protein [Verrucomicrobiales bacterium]
MLNNFLRKNKCAVSFCHSCRLRPGGLCRTAFLCAILCSLTSGCLIPPNERDYITANAEAGSVEKWNEWPYTTLSIGKASQPIHDLSPYYLVIRGEKVALAGLTRELIISMGGKQDTVVRRGWGASKGRDALIMEPSCHFILASNKVVQAKVTWQKSEPVVGVGRIGTETIYFLPLKESEVKELLGPAVKIREIPKW